MKESSFVQNLDGTEHFNSEGGRHGDRKLVSRLGAAQLREVIPQQFHDNKIHSLVPPTSIELADVPLSFEHEKA